MGNNLFANAINAARDVHVLDIAGGLMFATFALAYLCGMAFPPVEGVPSKISKIVAKLAGAVMVLLAIWFLSAAIDDLKFFRTFG